MDKSLKIVFISNYLSHHQLPFCEAMYALLGEGFHFVATEPMEEERRNMGWQTMEHLPYEVLAYTNSHEEAYAMGLSYDADVVIYGSAPDTYIVQRLKDYKLTFKYSERIFKNKLSFSYMSFKIIGSVIYHNTRFQKYPLYMLCASAYMPADCARFGIYRDRMFKWGYFPEISRKTYDEILGIKTQHVKPHIMWAARFIDFKKPLLPIQCAVKLRDAGYDFTMEMIGDGYRLQDAIAYAKDNRVDDIISFPGYMKAQDVLPRMEIADIFMTTSNYEEGWGAVLNEAMSCGCAVLASHAAGATAYLVSHKRNGLVFKSEDVDDAYTQLKWYLDNPTRMRECAQAAYECIHQEWNAQSAAERMIGLSESLLSGCIDSPYVSGPLSKAEVVKQDMMYEVLTGNL